MAHLTCGGCGETVTNGIVLAGEIYCDGCASDARDEPYDTASLQDSNPEAWGAAHNVNPWGMEGGY